MCYIAVMKYREKYLSRAKIAARALSFVPFLRLAGLNGSIVRGEDTQKSDIDFLIIGESRRLYTVRFFATLYVALTGWRRHGKRVAGRICLNCFLNDKSPDIRPKDPRSNKKVAWAYKYTVPLVQEGRITEKFFWSNDWFLNYKVPGQKYSERLQDGFFRFFPIRRRKISEKVLSGRFGDWLEKKLMDYQQRRILKGKNLFDETVATKSEIRLHPKK
jgi:predicted nucleotidyltransferase